PVRSRMLGTLPRIAEEEGLVTAPGVDLASHGEIAHDADRSANVTGVHPAGDCARGQSLIFRAIVDGRACAAAVEVHLRGHFADLSREPRREARHNVKD
ncbi:MAG: hypothetical protein L0H74_15240, partial [Brachybacterium sp.]|nr:hypothetical protein [Brachybacterium sp.]